MGAAIDLESIASSSEEESGGMGVLSASEIVNVASGNSASGSDKTSSFLLSGVERSSSAGRFDATSVGCILPSEMSCSGSTGTTSSSVREDEGDSSADDGEAISGEETVGSGCGTEMATDEASTSAEGMMDSAVDTETLELGTDASTDEVISSEGGTKVAGEEAKT